MDKRTDRQIDSSTAKTDWLIQTLQMTSKYLNLVVYDPSVKRLTNRQADKNGWVANGQIHKRIEGWSGHWTSQMDRQTNKQIDVSSDVFSFQFPANEVVDPVPVSLFRKVQLTFSSHPFPSPIDGSL